MMVVFSNITFHTYPRHDFPVAVSALTDVEPVWIVHRWYFVDAMRIFDRSANVRYVQAFVNVCDAIAQNIEQMKQLICTSLDL